MKAKDFDRLEAKFEQNYRAHHGVRWHRLTCPRCDNVVDVAHEHTRAWCTKHRDRTEMERTAT